MIAGISSSVSSSIVSTPRNTALRETMAAFAPGNNPLTVPKIKIDSKETFKPLAGFSRSLEQIQRSLGSSLRERSSRLRDSSYCKLLSSGMVSKGLIGRQLLGRGMISDTFG